MPTRSYFFAPPTTYVTWHTPSVSPSGPSLHPERSPGMRGTTRVDWPSSSPLAPVPPSIAERSDEDQSRGLSSAIRKLVVPLDGSALGEHALPVALHIAKLSGAEITFAHVQEPPFARFLGGKTARDKGLGMRRTRKSHEYLDDVCDRVTEASSVRINPLLLEGDGISGALREIAAVEADLVVMATRALGRLKALLTGSVAEALIDGAEAPVLLVRGTREKVDLDSSVSLRHALVPLDGSPGAERILDPLAALGQLEETEQTLIRVLPHPRYSPALRTCFSVYEFAAEQHDSALRDLEDSANVLRSRLPNVKTEVVFSDNAPAKEILLQAQSRKADLIAVATRRRSNRMKGLFEGSVTDTLIRKANVPLLITRQRDD